MSYQVTCRICGRKIGFMGLGKHSRKHKNELGEDCYRKLPKIKYKKKILNTSLTNQSILNI